MKKLICLLLALMMCAGCALAEEAGEKIDLRFEEGFGLTVPAGWVRYPVADDTIRYALGDAAGERFLYVLIQDTELTDFEAVRAAIDAREDCGKTSPLDLNGRSFAAFIMSGLNASGCATLLDGKLLVFLFTPQDNSDYMLTAAEIMASIRF